MDRHRRTSRTGSRPCQNEQRTRRVLAGSNVLSTATCRHSARDTAARLRRAAWRRLSLGSMLVLSQLQLDVLVAAAIERWTATGLTAKQIAAMRRVKIEIADLPGDYLAEVSGDSIRIDRDAGGYGWFVDATPMDDVEFATPSSGSRRYTECLREHLPVGWIYSRRSCMR